MSPAQGNRMAVDMWRFGRTFWPRRSAALLAASVVGLWALPIVIVYGLTQLF